VGSGTGPFRSPSRRRRHLRRASWPHHDATIVSAAALTRRPLPAVHTCRGFPVRPDEGGEGAQDQNAAAPDGARAATVEAVLSNSSRGAARRWLESSAEGTEAAFSSFTRDAGFLGAGEHFQALDQLCHSFVGTNQTPARKM
jgi:hypothetical protein